MSTNRSYLVLLMDQPDVNFGEVIKTLSTEEQDDFIELLAEISASALLVLKDAPQDIKVDALATALTAMPQEMKSTIAQFYNITQQGEL